MGGGQNEIALELVKNAAQKGEWVCLKNLHLVTSWLPGLEKELKLLTPDKKFRLWLTSEPHGKFPSILLQSSLKITYETPPGLRNNLQRTFNYVTPSQDTQHTQLLFVLSWFHALIQERRKYIPQGWSKYYEFSFGDLKAGELTLGSIQAENPGGKPQWQKIFGILENAIYGGRIANEFDLRVLRAYISAVFKDSILKGEEPLSNVIPVPQSANVRDYVGVINKVPEFDAPALFGLPANIDRSVQRFNSSAVVAQLKQLAAVSVEELRFDKAKWTAGLKPICEMWAVLYPKQAFEQLQVSKEQLNAADPVAAFVYMEVATAKEVLQAVHESISTITRILQGAEMLTAKSQKEATELLKGAVPGSWSSRWEGPEAPNAWISLVNKKAAALLTWAQRVSQQELLNAPIDLSDLFHPETFLNALRQRSARGLGIAIDELKLVSSFEQAKLTGKTTIQLDALALQGCEFDGRRMVDIRDAGGNSRELIMLPPCYIAWIGQSEPDPYPAESTVRTPIYHALDREELLCTIEAPNSGEASARIIAGVALFLAGDVGQL